MGAIQEILAKVATAKINVTSVEGVSAGGGRYGALLCVVQMNVKKAATALGATTTTALPTPPIASTAPAWAWPI